MTGQTITIDLKDRQREIEAELDRLDAGPGEVYDIGDLDLDADTWDDLDDDQRETLAGRLEDRRRELERVHDTIEQKIAEWDGSTFEIKEFMWGDQALRNDLVRGDAARSEYQTSEAQVGIKRLRTVQVGTVSTPPNAPDDPEKYPPVVGEWLYQAIEELNSYGEVRLGDFSDSGPETDSGSPDS